jgi:hypothetical protein
LGVLEEADMIHTLKPKSRTLKPRTGKIADTPKPAKVGISSSRLINVKFWSVFVIGRGDGLPRIGFRVAKKLPKGDWPEYGTIEFNKRLRFEVNKINRNLKYEGNIMFYPNES